MADHTQFKDLALPAIERGLRVCRLKPGDKRPLSEGWVEEATSSAAVAESWHAENPAYNCGAVVTADGGYWVVDVDCLEFLMDECPHDCLPAGETSTYTVATGGGGRHFYFAGKAPWDAIKHVKNPDKDRWRKPDGSECSSVIDVICDRGQVLVAGNVHPKSGKPYRVEKDVAMREASPMFVGWLRSLLEGKAASRQKPKAQGSHDNAWTVDPDFDPDAAFEGRLRYERKNGRGDKGQPVVFFNCHVKMGMCLVKGALHIGDGGGNERNNDCSAFVWDPQSRQLWFKCHAGGCVGERARETVEVALARIGLDPEEVFYKEGRRGLEFVDLDKVEGSHIEWLWPGYLPQNRLVGFAGDSTQGKSPVTLSIISRLSSGANWPDGTRNEAGPKKAILLAAEDDLHDTIVPRLQLEGADMRNVKALRPTVNVKMSKVEPSFSFDEDLVRLDALLAKHAGEFALIVVDPITNYLGPKIKMNDEIPVRAILQPLSKLAQRHKVCVVIVCHVNKRTDVAKAGDKVMGARAFRGVSRGVFYFDADPDSTDKYAHVIVAERLDAKSLRFKTAARPWTKDGRTSEQVVVEWLGYSDATLDDVGKGPSGKDKNDTQLAGEALREMLKGGPMPASDCKEALREMGYVMQADKGPLNETRVKKAAGGVDAKKLNTTWVWSLKKNVDQGDDFVSARQKEMFKEKENHDDEC